jgi:hypothetical protein
MYSEYMIEIAQKAQPLWDVRISGSNRQWLNRQFSGKH